MIRGRSNDTSVADDVGGATLVEPGTMEEETVGDGAVGHRAFAFLVGMLSDRPIRSSGLPA